MSVETPSIHTSAQLRPALHESVDRLADDDLAVLHRVAMKLELEAVSGRLDDAFDRDREEGKLDHTADLIRSAREALRSSSAA